MLKRNLFIVLLFLFSNVSLAADYPTGYRAIERVGCHLRDNICYAYLDGPEIGIPKLCESDSVRWVTDQPNGREMLSLIMSAYHAKTRMAFVIDSCLAQQPSYPTFRNAITEPK